jgi:flagellar hook-associated protein 3 FlgL
MMRITDAFRYNFYVTTLNNIQAQINRDENEVASGLQVIDPSDNPAAYSQNMEIQAEESTNTQYATTLNSLTTQGTFYSSAVNTIGNVLTSVQQLAIEQSSSTVNADSRSSAADEVNGLIEQLAAVGNTKVGDSYIFGGTMSNNAPYAVDTSSGAPVVTFEGSADVNQVAVTSSTTVDAGISGNTIFNGTVSGETVTIGGVAQSNIDLFKVLQQFSQDLANTAGLTTAQQTTALQTDLANINNCVDLTADNLASVGTYTKNISNLLTANGTASTTLSEDSGDLVNANMAKVVSDYSTLTTAYQAALYTMSKMESLSILNYLSASSV